MLSARPAAFRSLIGGFGIIGIGVLVGLATDVALTLLTPAKFVFLLGGFALLIPTMVLAEPKPYWLFLLVLSIPFDITKWLSTGMVDSQALVAMYGMPASGTVGLEIYLTDIVLVAVSLPWLARLCLKRERLYFPNIGYIFLLYLAWSLLVSLINSVSLYLTMFEFCRQLLYFLFFVYLINAVKTRLHVRSVVSAVFLGLIIGASSVIIFFELGIGTDTVAFASLHDQPTTTAQNQTHKEATKGWAPEKLTVQNTHGLLDRDRESAIQRSQGMFRHPAIPAGLCGLTLPVALAYLLAAKNYRDRILLGMLYGWGVIALLLTFSRAGLIGFIAGTFVFFAVAGWSGLISRRLVALFAVISLSVTVFSIPLLLVYFEARSETFFMRFNMMEAAVLGYAQHPLLGVGLNNGTASMKESRQELRDMGIPVAPMEPADSYYLAVVTEVGPVGSVLYFGFIVQIVMIALRAIKEVPVDIKPLLVGMVTGLASLATQSLGDGPLAGHAVGGTLWLFAALIVAIARYSSAKTRSSKADGKQDRALA
jgi:hypothetical protein